MFGTENVADNGHKNMRVADRKRVGVRTSIGVLLDCWRVVGNYCKEDVT